MQPLRWCVHSFYVRIDELSPFLSLFGEARFLRITWPPVEVAQQCH